MDKVDRILDDHVDLIGVTSDEVKYKSLYAKYDDRLEKIFSHWHDSLMKLFDFMNYKSKTTSHFNASESRDLIAIVEQIHDLVELLKGTRYEFSVDPYIEEKLAYCSKFLANSGGSAIPEDFQKIALKKYDAIFSVVNETVSLNTDEDLLLKNIGEGAFAVVSRYKDPVYAIYFAVKQLKKGAGDREVERFKSEYQILSKLSSPYVLQVYWFDEKRNRYCMEYCDTTLKNYFDKNNAKLNFYTRKRIAQQFLYGICYLHHKKILHRDLSYQNILIKKYDSRVLGVKLSDFGLVKAAHSEFTKSDTELKGTIIDPALDNFKDYNLKNEIYAIGYVINYIFTGKKGFSYKPDYKLLDIIYKCVNQDLTKRYEDVQSILNDVDRLQEIDVPKSWDFVV